MRTGVRPDPLVDEARRKRAPMPPDSRTGGKLSGGMAATTESPSPPVPSDPDAADDDLKRKGRRRPLYILTVLAVAVLIGGWVYLLFFYDPGLMIDELADKTFPTQAEEVCAAAVSQLDELPVAQVATSPIDRADTLERSDVILTQMVDDLRPLVPVIPPGLEGKAKDRATEIHDGINAWLDDWEVYIGDREEYVENLRTDPEARFLETKKALTNKGITRAIDGFAEVNEMTSCATPADVS